MDTEQSNTGRIQGVVIPERGERTGASSTFTPASLMALQTHDTGKQTPSRKRQSHLAEETKVGTWAAKGHKPWWAKHPESRKPQGSEPEMLLQYLHEVLANPRLCAPGRPPETQQTAAARRLQSWAAARTRQLWVPRGRRLVLKGHQGEVALINTPDLQLRTQRDPVLEISSMRSAFPEPKINPPSVLVTCLYSTYLPEENIIVSPGR